MDTLGFGCILPTAGRIGDFHPLERVPTGHTKKKTPPKRCLKCVQEKRLELSWYCYHTDLNRARLPIPPFLLTVREMGLEPTRLYGHKILSLACLPIPALPRTNIYYRISVLLSIVFFNFLYVYLFDIFYIDFFGQPYPICREIKYLSVLIHSSAKDL